MVVAICIRLIEDGQEVDHKTFRFTQADALLKGFTDLRDQYPTGVFHTANFTEPTPPPAGHEVPHGYYWCPWCADDMPFYMDVQFCVNRCVSCRMSDNDWFVNKFNDVRLASQSRETADDNS